MKIEVLGIGCPKCKILYDNVQSAVKEIGVEAEVEKVEDMDKITDYGIMTTPALVIDGVVKVAGKVRTVEEIKDFIN